MYEALEVVGCQAGVFEQQAAILRMWSAIDVNRTEHPAGMGLMFLWRLIHSAFHIYASSYKGDASLGGPLGDIAIDSCGTSDVANVIWQRYMLHVTCMGFKFLTRGGGPLYCSKGGGATDVSDPPETACKTSKRHRSGGHKHWFVACAHFE